MPEITERKSQNTGKFLLAILSGLVLALIFVLVMYFTELDRKNASIVAAMLVFIYAAILLFLTETKTTREIKTTDVKYVGRPVEVIRTVDRPVHIIKTVDRPVEVIRTVEKPVVRIVEKPVEVIRTRTRTINKPVYIQVPRKIPQGVRHKYVGSKEGGVYHNATSRLARLIRPKNRVYTDSFKRLEKMGLKPSFQIKKEREEERRKAKKRK